MKHNKILKLIMIAFAAILTTSYIKQSYKPVNLNSLFTKQEKKYASESEPDNLPFCFTDSTASIDQLDAYGYKWDLSTKTLTLNNFDLSKTPSMPTYFNPAIILPANSTIYLEENSVNTIQTELSGLMPLPTKAVTFPYTSSSAGIYVGDTTGSSTLTIKGSGSLSVSVGHYDPSSSDTTSEEPTRITYGIYGNLIIGDKTDCPNVFIETRDDSQTKTITDAEKGSITYRSAAQVLPIKSTVTLNSGLLHLKAGAAYSTTALYQSTLDYYNGKLILESSTDNSVCVNSFSVYGTTINTKGNCKISKTDKDGNTIDSITSQTKYAVIDVYKSIAVESKTGELCQGKISTYDISYSTDGEVDDDTISLEYYDSKTKSYTSNLPSGLSYDVDKNKKVISLKNDGTTISDNYQFRLKIMANKANLNSSFYSDAFVVTVKFKSDGSEYDSNYVLKQSENPVVTNKPIEVVANEGYSVSLDGINYFSAVTYSSESSKDDRTNDAVLYIKNTTTNIVDTVSFNYSYDPTAPTFKLNDSGEYKTPSNKQYVNSKVTLNITDVNDNFTENSDLKVQYVLLSKAYSESELSSIDKTLTWSDLSLNNDSCTLEIDGEHNETKIAYIKVTDEADNVTYIASDIYVFNKKLPVISGVDENTNYYVSTSFTVDEENVIVKYKKDDNSEEITMTKNDDGEYILNGNTSTNYIVTVTDQAGNQITKTIKMNTIATLENDIKDLTVANVKSSDISVIDGVIDIIDKIDQSSATEEEKNLLNNILSKCNSLKNKQEQIQVEYNSLSGINYSTLTVTTDDKSDIEKITDRIDVLLNGSNLTTEEQSNLNTIKENLDNCLSIINDVETSFNQINNAISGISMDNVTSGNKETLSNCYDECLRLLATSNLTGDERSQLLANKDKISSLLNVIENTTASINNIKENVSNISLDNVSEDDETLLNKTINDIDSLLSSSHLTSDEINDLNQIRSRVNTYLDKITSVKNEIEDISSKVDSFTSESTSEESINAEKTKINSLLNSNNLSDTQRENLNGLLVKCNNMILAKTKDTALANIKDKTKSYNTDSVNGSDKDDIESAIHELDNLLTTYDSLLTIEEKSNLNSIKENLNNCLSIIDDVKSTLNQINTLTDNVSADNINSSNKEGLQQAKSLITTLLSTNNLTDEERASLNQKLTNIESLLAKLENTSNDITNANSKITDINLDNVNSSNKDEIQQVIDDIDALLASNNLTDEEREQLKNQKDKATKLLAKIQETKDKIDSINSQLETLSDDNVNSSNKDTLIEGIEEIDTLLNSGNVTEEEKETLTTKRKEANRLLNKVNDTINAYNSVTEELEKLTEDENVDLDKLNNAINEAETLSESSNLTSKEKESLISLINKAKKLYEDEQIGSLIPLIICLSIFLIAEIAFIIYSKKRKKEKTYCFLPLSFVVLTVYPMYQIIISILLGIAVVLLAAYIIYSLIKKAKHKNSNDDEQYFE